MKVKNDHRSKFSNLSNWKEEAWKKKISASTGFKPVTFALPVRCCTNLARKPHIGSEVNLLSSHLPWGVKWCEVYEITHFLTVVVVFFFRLLLSNCWNWKIYCNDHSSLSSTTAVQKWIISYTSHHTNPCKFWNFETLTKYFLKHYRAQISIMAQ